MLFDESHRAPQARAPRIEPVSIRWLERLLTLIGVWGLATVVGGALGCCLFWLTFGLPSGEPVTSIGFIMGELASMWPLFPLFQLTSPFAVWYVGMQLGVELRPVALVLAVTFVVEAIGGVLFISRGTRKSLWTFAVAMALTSLVMPLTYFSMLSI